MAINQPPPPPLRTDIEKLVFTHKSLFGKPASIIDDSEDPQDWERVAFLGEGILLAAMSRVLYYAYPRRRTSALKPTRTGLLSKESLAAITDSYRFMEKLKCLEPSRPNIARSLDNRAALAESFIGGLALQYGMDQARKWAEQMLAWKHGLPVPKRDEERLGIGGSGMTSEGKDVAMKDVGGDAGMTKGHQVPIAAMAAYPTPPAAPPPVISSPPPPTARFAQPVQIPPRPEYAQIKPPQEVPKPIMDWDIPVQEPIYNPGMYQPMTVHQEVAATAAAAATPTKPTTYNAGSFYPISSYQSPPQPAPHKHTPASQQAPPTIQPPLQPTEYKNYSNPPVQTHFFDTISSQQSPPQPQFQPPTKHVPAWNPQVPGANLFSYEAPSPIGPTAVPNKAKGSPPTKGVGSSTPLPPLPTTGFVTVAKLNEQAQKRCQRLQWTFDSQGQGQYIAWTARLYGGCLLSLDLVGWIFG
ncbi:hypothetical protein M407DRAFT_17459 [Tulasnella calospora MUT 4182]|uniref:RNase III domain-containing protein n=1 Tax=Tulasnella calospora MUT 4182 TaxID=1051891 RepID=A0A0C3LIR0_9AGAM|nr:hypothetical protein M407DRAFT_17459 [Tulasnella calospora MUT 4182]